MATGRSHILKDTIAINWIVEDTRANMLTYQNVLLYMETSGFQRDQREFHYSTPLRFTPMLLWFPCVYVCLHWAEKGKSTSEGLNVRRFITHMIEIHL